MTESSKLQAEIRIPSSFQSPQGVEGRQEQPHCLGRSALGPGPQASLSGFVSVINLWKASKLGVNTVLQISSNPCLHLREKHPGGGFHTVITFGFLSGEKNKMKHLRSDFLNHLRNEEAPRWCLVRPQGTSQSCSPGRAWEGG